MSGTVHKTLEQIREEGGGYIDAQKVDVQTEEEVELQAKEDGTDDAITEDVLRRARIVKPYYAPETT